jgi:hypothetical protein
LSLFALASADRGARPFALASFPTPDDHGFMDGSGHHENKPRTLAAQPAAAAEFGGQAAGVVVAPPLDEAECIPVSASVPRTRLERLLIAARQMQQR